MTGKQTLARSEGPHPESGEWVMVPREPTDEMIARGAHSPSPERRKGSPSMIETGWLIEEFSTKTNQFKARWWDGEAFVKDSVAAMRFGRRQDAQRYIDDIGWTEAVPTEHQWSDGALGCQDEIVPPIRDEPISSSKGEAPPVVSEEMVINITKQLFPHLFPETGTDLSAAQHQRSGMDRVRTALTAALSLPRPAPPCYECGTTEVYGPICVKCNPDLFDRPASDKGKKA